MQKEGKMRNEKFNYILSYIYEDMLCDKKTTLTYLDDIAKETIELKDKLSRRNMQIKNLENKLREQIKLDNEIISSMKKKQYEDADTIKNTNVSFEELLNKKL